MKDDSKIRKELAEMIGLVSVPDIDPNAIDRLDGLFDDLVDGPTDCVQLLKESRIRDFYREYHSSLRSVKNEKS